MWNMELEGLSGLSRRPTVGRYNHKPGRWVAVPIFAVRRGCMYPLP